MSRDDEEGAEVDEEPKAIGEKRDHGRLVRHDRVQKENTQRQAGRVGRHQHQPHRPLQHRHALAQPQVLVTPALQVWREFRSARDESFADHVGKNVEAEADDRAQCTVEGRGENPGTRVEKHDENEDNACRERRPEGVGQDGLNGLYFWDHRPQDYEQGGGGEVDEYHHPSSDRVGPAEPFQPSLVLCRKFSRFSWIALFALLALVT